MRRLIRSLIGKAIAYPKTSIFIALLLPVLLVCGMNLWIVTSTDSRVFNDTSALPGNDVVLVLGLPAGLAVML